MILVSLVLELTREVFEQFPWRISDWRLANRRAKSLGISMDEYVRKLVGEDLRGDFSPLTGEDLKAEMETIHKFMSLKKKPRRPTYAEVVKNLHENIVSWHQSTDLAKDYPSRWDINCTLEAIRLLSGKEAA